MASVRRTEGGFEITKQFAWIVGLLTIVTIFVTWTAAAVRASDRIADATPRPEMHDSLRAIRRDELVRRIADSVHEANQDSASSWYARQTWRLICKQSGNPEAFCSDKNGIMQAGRPRTP